MNLSQRRHVDHGYASTSHAAQGAAVDRVIVNVDSMRNAQLVNRMQFYMSISGPGTTLGFTLMMHRPCGARSGSRKRKSRLTPCNRAAGPGTYLSPAYYSDGAS